MQTVVSVLEDQATAQRAVERLVAAGFERSQVHLQLGAAPSNTAATSPRAVPQAQARAESGPDRGVLSSIGYFFASLFNQDPPTGGYADRFAEAVRRGHPAIMVEANDDEEVDRASEILHDVGAFDVDERMKRWRKDAGMDLGFSSTTADTDQARPRADRPGVRVFRRNPGRSIRDLFSEHQERAASRSVVNRPASTEGESRVIDRTEGARAVASEHAREPRVAERDAEDREPKVTTPRRDT